MNGQNEGCKVGIVQFNGARRVGPNANASPMRWMLVVAWAVGAVFIIQENAAAMEDVATGRWITRDPIHVQLKPWHPYVYLESNPLSLRDPKGENAEPPDHDTVELYCAPSGIGGSLGGSHCTAVCNGVTIDGTGPMSPGGGNPGGNGNPGIAAGQPLNPNATLVGGGSFQAGACACLGRAGDVLNNAVPNKVYRVTSSNSNSALSCIMQACGIAMSPPSGMGTGWGTPVIYDCRCNPDDVGYDCGEVPCDVLGAL